MATVDGKITLQMYLDKKQAEAELNKNVKQLENRARPVNVKGDFDGRVITVKSKEIFKQLTTNANKSAKESASIFQQAFKEIGNSVKTINTQDAINKNISIPIKNSAKESAIVFIESFKEIKSAIQSIKVTDAINKNITIPIKNSARESAQVFQENFERIGNSVQSIKISDVINKNITRPMQNSAKESAKAFEQAFNEIEARNKQFDTWFLGKQSHKNAQTSASVFESSNKDIFNTNNKQFEQWFTPNLSSTTKSAKESASAFEELFGKAQKSKVGLSEVEKQIVKLNPALKEAHKHSLDLGESLSTAAYKMLVWTAVGGAIFGAMRQIKEATTYIINLDNALNQIRIVTNQSQAEVNKLAKEYNQLGKEMGVTTTEIAKQAVELYRQGLTGGEVDERLQSIIKYAKISGISLADSNKIITATANATGESVNKIIDIFAQLGDKTASGADEIGEALQRVAGTAESMSVPIEKAASWIATISSKTREGAGIIGNSLKSMMARYAQIKEKGFNEEDATDINQVTRALREVGIVAVDQSGQLRNFGDVIDELMVKWPSLTENQKRYVATSLGGKMCALVYSNVYLRNELYR